MQLSIYTSIFLLFQLGYELDNEQLENIFWRFKAVADQKKVSKKRWYLFIYFLKVYLSYGLSSDFYAFQFITSLTKIEEI